MISRRPFSHARDPFSSTADPDSYVPRTATEAVLVRLEMALRAGAPAVVLGGPAGSGKTLLLRVLTERLDGDFQVVYAPYPKLAADEFFHWGMVALNQPPGDDPETTFRERIALDAAAGFPPLLLMIDDAGCMPADTVRRLLEIQVAHAVGLRLLFVSSAAFRTAEIERAGVEATAVELEGGMDELETARYLRTRLDRAHVDTRRRSELESMAGELHALSRGNPGRLNALASEALNSPPRERAGGSTPHPKYQTVAQLARNQGDPP
jgi:type II secretory pathway predicted ATPase ExeA